MFPILLLPGSCDSVLSAGLELANSHQFLHRGLCSLETFFQQNLTAFMVIFSLRYTFCCYLPYVMHFCWLIYGSLVCFLDPRPLFIRQQTNASWAFSDVLLSSIHDDDKNQAKLKLKRRFLKHVIYLKKKSFKFCKKSFRS